MAKVNIPIALKEKLEDNQELNGIVNIALSKYGDILEESKLYFFNEYTNHGIKHIEDLLKSTEMLLTENTYKNILEFKDFGFYILSVLSKCIGNQKERQHKRKKLFSHGFNFD